MRVVDIAGRSDAGRVRKRNEDCLVAVDLDQGSELDLAGVQQVSGKRGPLLIVCDGMGGSVGGDIASQMACRVIRQEMQSCAPTANRAILARNLRNAVRKANREISSTAAADKALKGMGTTVSTAAIVGNTAVIAQVGDSRAYVLRGTSLTQITRDQSVVSALVQSGQLTEEDARYSMQRGRILQALGASDDVEVSLSIAELRAHDRLLLCSDGLHELLTDEEIREACSVEDLSVAVTTLVGLANEAGGHDNISVIVAAVTGEHLAPPLPGDNELRFIEIDPSLEGESALSSTSIVGRRLAHRAGLRKEGAPAAIPNTAQHAIVAEPDSDSPAGRALAERGKIGWAAGLGIGCVGLVVLAYLLGLI